MELAILLLAVLLHCHSAKSVSEGNFRQLLLVFLMTVEFDEDIEYPTFIKLPLS